MEMVNTHVEIGGPLICRRALPGLVFDRNVDDGPSGAVVGVFMRKKGPWRLSDSSADPIFRRVFDISVFAYL